MARLAVALASLATLARPLLAQTGPPAFVQANWTAKSSSSVTVASTYSAAQTAGNLNVVVVTWNDATAQVQAVTDTTGNTYQRAVGPTTRSSAASQSLYFAINKTTTVAGANAVTVTFSVAATTPEIRIAEYSGIDPLQPLDVAVGSSGNSSSSSSGSATTRNAADLIVGANWASGVTTGAGSGYTARTITTPGDILEDRVVTSAGTYSATAPVSPSGAWIMQLAAFRSVGSPQPDLTLTKTHSGSFVQGQSGATYTLTVRNSGGWPTAGAVTVTDTLPAGLTATAISGSGWTCTLATITCTRSTALSAGSTFPSITLTVSVSASAPASVTNTATVSGGGETNATNDTAADPTTITPPTPDLTLTKTHSAVFAQGQVGAKYTLTVRNSGTGPTSGVVTVTDVLPTGLTATALSGTGWSCTVSTVTCTRNSTLAAGSSYPGITLTVNVAANAPPSVTNTATVSGGGEINTANNTATDPTIVTQLPDLTISSTHAGTFTQGQAGAAYTIAVTNTGAGVTNSTVTVTDTVPSGLTAISIGGTGWSCTQPAGPCTRSDALAAGATYPTLALTVNVAANAPASVTNAATVGGGGETNTANDTASDVTAIAAATPDLTIAETHATTFVQGQSGAAYALTVSNVGVGPSVGTVTVTDVVPSGLIVSAIGGTGWSCVQPAGPCTRSDALAPGSAFPALALTVNVAANAPSAVVASATVAVAGDTSASNNTATDPTTITQVPDITVAAVHAGTFVQGQSGALFTVTVSNAGFAPTSGLVTMTDVLPAGLAATSLAGAGWACSVPMLTCTRADAIPAGASYPPIALVVDVAPDAPPSVTNVATVAGGGENNAANDTTADPTTIVAVPDLIATLTHAGAFAQGETGARYSIGVKNVGSVTASGVVTVHDALPEGLTATAMSGAGWTCDLQALACTRADALAPGASYASIDVIADVAIDAAASVTNVATVSGGGEVNTANDVASDDTAITPPSDLVVAAAHVGAFVLGQIGASYTVTVSNAGPGVASGPVTLTDTLPPGLILTGLSGAGWTCAPETVSCSRSDGLAAGASFPPIVVTVTVGFDTPPTIANTVVVSGGGETNADNDTSLDATTIVPPADVTIANTHSGTFAQGLRGAVYVLTVTNVGGGSSSGAVTVVDSLPAALTASALAGDGWSCALATLTCVRSDVLMAGASYAPITLTVDVSSHAPAIVTNTATVGGGGDANVANNAASDTADVAGLPDVIIGITHAGSFTQGQSGAAYTIAVTNAGAGPTVGPLTVAITPPAALTATMVSGDGWSCAVGTLTCTRSDAIASGAAYPPIVLVADIAANAPPTVTLSASVSGGGESDTSNDASSDSAAVVQLPNLTVSVTHAGSFVQGQTSAAYTLVVSNTGAASTLDVVTVADTLPAALAATDLSGSGWACAVATLTCSRSDALPPGGSYPPVSLTVSVAADAASAVVNTARVGGGGETNTADDSATDTTTILAPADLTIALTHSGSFTQGQAGATYTLTVSNVGGAPSSGTVTLSDALPTGLTATAIVGAGWTCTLTTLTCTRADAIAPGAAYAAVTLTVDVATNASASIVNSALVSGGGDASSGNNTATDATDVAQMPDLTLSVSHAGPFTQGQSGAAYAITVTNAGSAPTSGVVSVSDAVPVGLVATALAGSGWDCALATLTCSRSDALAPGSAFTPIAVTVDVSVTAPASVTNSATVSGGGERVLTNDTASDVTAVAQLADVTVSITHAGSFVRGQTAATYSILVSNAGAAATTAAVTVSDALPADLTPVSFGGAGWSCTVSPLACVRADALAAGTSYPTLTLSVSVAVNAAGTLVNSVTVAGGGEANGANDTAVDTATVVAPADLTLAIAHTGTFTLGQTGATYTVSVANAGAGPTSDVVVVSDALPAGLSATAMAGAGWTCTLATLTCTRADALGAGATYPTITLTVSVAPSAPATVVNAGTVSGGGELNTANDGAADPTTIVPAVSPPVFVTEAHFAIDQITSGPNRATLSLNVSGSNTLLLAALHVELDGGDTNWVATDNGVPGTQLVDTDGYTGGSGNQRFRIYYWLNPPAGTNTIVIQNGYVGANEIAAAAVLFSNVSQTAPLGAITLDVSTTPRTSESETVTTGAGDLVLHVIADAVFTPGALGAGETSISLANDGLQKQSAGDGDASLWISTKPGAAPSTTVSSSGWPSGPAPSPRVLNGVGLVLHGAGPDVQPPTAPGSLIATGVSSTQIALSWTAATDNVGVVGYRIERCQGSGCAAFTEIAAVAGTATTFADSAVTSGNTYAYRVRAADAAGNMGPYSNAASATVPVPDTQPPSAPGTLTASAPNGTHVNVSWGAATDNVAVMDYRVERCDGVCTTAGFVKIVTTPALTFVDATVKPSTTYTYIVSAEDTSNNLGPYSNVATVTTPATVPELIAAYSFEEGTGTSVNDSSGYNRTGTIANGTWVSTGRYGKALSFNGSSTKITIPDDPGLHLSSAMTLEAWVNPSTVTSAWRDVIYKGNDNYFLMGTTSQSGRPSVGGTFGGANVNNYGPAVLAVNAWSHLAATYDGSMLRLYVNGTQVASAARSGTLAASTNSLQIGGDSIFGQYFKGLIDEVRIYNIALTPTQIQTDMATAIGAASPVAVLTPTTVDFGAVPTGTKSAGQSVTITNAGTAPLVVGSISLGGVNAADFGQSSACVTTIAPGSTCSVTVTMTPQAVGTRTAALTVVDNAAGSPHVVSLAGTGTGFTITPRVSVLTPALTQQFGVSGGNGGTLAWSVDGVAGGDATRGTISPTGLYTPPAVGGTHTVTVTTSLQQTSTAAVYVTTYPGTFTHHNDNMRTGQNLNEIVLTPANVNAARFGKLLSYSLDGLSIASPLYVAGVAIPGQGVHNVVYVATEHDSVYAFDADGLSAVPLWQQSFLGPGVTTVPAADTGECCDISPEIGITGTPVIDPATGTLYVVAKTKEGASTYVQRLHALDLATGAEKFGGPVVIQATVPGNGNGSSAGQISFDPLRENQRPSLLLSNRVVYVGFGSHGDHQPYHGWLLGYDASTLQQVMAFNVSPNADGGGLWQANGGPAADAAGNLYVISGNGAFDANTGGADYGDSFLKITPAGAVADYFTPWNQGSLNANDFDLGAAGPLLLPDQPGPHPHLMVSAGKNNTIYLVDRDAMGHFSGTTSDSQIVQSLVNIFPFGTPEPGNYSAPVYFNGSVFFGPIADSIQAFPLTNGLLRTTPLSRSADVYKYPGATLAISAAGAANGILWAIQRNGDCGVQPSCPTAAPGVLKAYDASNLGTLLYSSDQMGPRDMFDFATKFSVPLVANGKVFVASVGQLTVYGLLP